jgi:hypothetical protein
VQTAGKPNGRRVEGTDEGGRYRISYGRKIYYQELDTGIVAHKRRNKDDLFSFLQHKDTVPAFKALGCPGALVWVALMWRTRIENKDTVKLPTGKLQDWGVSRQTYTKALRRLEAAGHVRLIYSKPRSSPMVEILTRWA